MKKLADETVYTPVKRMIEESNRRILIDMGFLNEDGTRKDIDIIEGFDFHRDERGNVIYIEGDDYTHIDIVRDERQRVVLMTQADVASNRLIHWYYIYNERFMLERIEPYYTDLEDIIEDGDEGIELYDESDTSDGATEVVEEDDLTELEAMTEDEMVEDDEENEFTEDEMKEWGD